MKTRWRALTKEKKGANLGEYSLSAMVEDGFVRQRWYHVEELLLVTVSDVC